MFAIPIGTFNARVLFTPRLLLSLSTFENMFLITSPLTYSALFPQLSRVLTFSSALVNIIKIENYYSV